MYFGLHSTYKYPGTNRMLSPRNDCCALQANQESAVCVDSELYFSRPPIAPPPALLTTSPCRRDAKACTDHELCHMEDARTLLLRISVDSDTVQGPLVALPMSSASQDNPENQVNSITSFHYPKKIADGISMSTLRALPRCCTLLPVLESIPSTLAPDRPAAPPTAFLRRLFAADPDTFSSLNCSWLL